MISLYFFLQKGGFMDGIILINKEKGYTSRDVVNLIGKHFHTKKVGHTGTLDPMAEGLLMICIGSCTKLVEVLTQEEKEYTATITLGIETDTLDIEGTILKSVEVKKTKEEIEYALQKLTGTYVQEVPLYSAIKKDGKKLYEYAREGKQVELPKREVTIFSLNLTKDIQYENGKTIFQIHTKVSKGTYIRSLVRDIAYHLDTIGTMTSLVRTKVGTYCLSQACTLKELEEGKYQLLSAEQVLKDYPKVVADEFLEQKIKNGSILENCYSEIPFAFYNKQNKLLALYQLYEKDPSKIKPWKMF